MNSVVIVDYGMGNIGSIVNMLKSVSVKAEVTGDPQRILAAKKIILPGVGAFDHGMENLRARQLIEPLQHKVLTEKTPVLGICLGMQLMANQSEEGQLPGLGWISGEILKFRPTQITLKVPHMGWNAVSPTKTSVLLAQKQATDLAEDQRFYFVHSYYFKCTKNEDVLATTSYGETFASAVQRENIFGVQFHPEKSHKYGKLLFEQFAKIDVLH